MFDATKVADLREAIAAVAAEYESNGVPDVARKLRELGSVSPASLARLADILSRTDRKEQTLSELKSGTR